MSLWVAFWGLRKRIKVGWVRESRYVEVSMVVFVVYWA